MDRDQPAWAEWLASARGLAPLLLTLDTAAVRVLSRPAGERPVTQLLRQAFAAGYEAGRKGVKP